MSLFPAYANVEDHDSSNPYETENGSQAAVEYMESQLLASDEEAVAEASVKEVSTSEVPAPLNEDFYLDTKLDPGNLRVSTLYYPGRPQYFSREKTRPRVHPRRRYYEEVAIGESDDEVEISARVAAFRRMLADTPADEDLWLRFIDFQERWRGGEEALRTASEAAERLPRAERLRHSRLALAARQLPAEHHLSLLREHIAAEKSPGVRTELWVRLLAALASAPSLCSAPALAAAARAAVADLRHYPPAYPHLLYTYGAFLRSAGLWEQLILLIELVTAMNYPPSPGFPPPIDANRQEAVDRELLDKEDKMIRSGMPVCAVWARVERARAAAHWRAAGGPELAADPQRAPAAAELAELLQPAGRGGLALPACALALAKVPLLPASQRVSAAAGGCAAGALRGAGWAAGGGEALLAPLRAARRLPPAHPARPATPALAAKILAHFLDPPHYFVDDSGYLSWVTALWDACCSWVSGDQRVALLCWRLRWLHSLMLLVDSTEESGAQELRRLRRAARALLRREAGCGPLPFAAFARLELAAAGRAPARLAALLALRAARDAAPAEHRLYVARYHTFARLELAAAGRAPARLAALLALRAARDAAPAEHRLYVARYHTFARLELAAAGRAPARLAALLALRAARDAAPAEHRLYVARYHTFARLELAAAGRAPARLAALLALRAARDAAPAEHRLYVARYHTFARLELAAAGRAPARLAALLALRAARDAAPAEHRLYVARYHTFARLELAAAGRAPARLAALLALRAARDAAPAEHRLYVARYHTFARLELAAAGRAPARLAALLALRAARDAAPAEHRLYVARIVSEICETNDPTGRWAVASAALGRPLPPDEQLLQPPPADLLQDALRMCEEKCNEIERNEATNRDFYISADELCAAMLPSVGEWAAARAYLAPPSLRPSLFTRALQAGAGASEPTRYEEHAACALVVAAAADHRASHYARVFAPRFPDNAFLVLMSSGAPLWSRQAASAEARLAGGPPATDAAAVCSALAALLRAGAPAAWSGAAAAGLARAARRAGSRGAGGALLRAVRLEAEARSARPDPERALLAAIDAQPHAKWLYVRGAQWCSRSAGELPDLLLDKQLRLHALTDELEPPPALP